MRSLSLLTLCPLLFLAGCAEGTLQIDPDDEQPDDELPDDEQPDDEQPDDEQPDDEQPDDEQPFACTLVIGYSQVGLPFGGWFSTNGVFESVVEDDRWQLLWNGGGGVDLWQDPDYEGWSQDIESPCAVDSASPDRVLLSVSGPYGEDVDGWVEAIDATIDEIARRFPSLRSLILQPVVGGPDEALCYARSGTEVRASWQHPFIDQAIEQAVGGWVVAGASPTVDTCDRFLDERGHLNRPGAEVVAAELGAFYVEWDQP